MDNITLILQGNKNEIQHNISILMPLISRESVETIVICKDFQPPHGINILHWDQEVEVSNFRKFCYKISKYDKIIIIDEGLEVSKEFVDELVKLIDEGKINENIMVKIKYYLNDEEYFVKTEPIIINQNSSEKKYISCQLENYYFSHITNTTDIKKAVYKLLEKEYFSEMSIWFYKFINVKDEFREAFYEAIEYWKMIFNKEKANKIDEFLFEHILDRDYTRFKKLQLMLYKNNRSDKILKQLKKINYTEANVYLSYIIADLIDNRQLLMDFLLFLDKNVRVRYISYQMNNERIANQIINILNLEEIQKEILKYNNSLVEVFYDIVKLYITKRINLTCGINERLNVAKLFSIFMNCAIYLLNSETCGREILSADEREFIKKIDKGINLYKAGERAQAIDIFEQCKEIIPEYSYFMHLYIQGLENELDLNRYKLSICMIVKDEEENLERCIKSLKPLCDKSIAELIIVDTGSTDNTIEIAKKYTQNVFNYNWNNNFSEARNFSIMKARGEYIFIIDADEELEEKGIDELINLFSNENYNEYNTFTFKIKNFKDSSLKQYGINVQPLIFRNDALFFYYGSVHNQPYMKGPVKNLDIYINHYGYIMSNEEIKKRKFYRTGTLLKKELSKNADNIYYWYQLAVSHGMYGDMDGALKYVEVYMKYMKDIEKEASIKHENLMPLNYAARTYLTFNKLDEVIKICDVVLKQYPDLIDLVYYKAEVFLRRKNYSEAVKWFSEYLSLLDEFKYHDIFNDNSLIFYTLDLKNSALKMLFYSLYKEERFSECVDIALKIDDEMILLELLNEIFEVVMKTGEYKALVKLYEDRVLNSGGNLLGEKFVKTFLESVSRENEDIQNNIIDEFLNSDCEQEFVAFLKLKFNHRRISGKKSFRLDKFYNIDGCIENIEDLLYIVRLKEALKFLLKRSNLTQILGEDKVFSLIEKYIESCIYLVQTYNEHYMEQRELNLLSFILDGMESMQKKELSQTIASFKKAIHEYEDMARPLEVYIKAILKNVENAS
jgi:glycosyltransferase involved in cell wall biosynthesis